MNVRALLEELEHLGVELRVVGDELEYEGPEAAVTLELLERLKAHKAELMAVCGKRETVAEEGRQPAESMRIRTVADPDTRKLLAAGWEPKQRCWRTIWKRSGGGFYYSREMATHLLDTGISSVGCQSGANERG
jgi:hypothetical protein